MERGGTSENGSANGWDGNEKEERSVKQRTYMAVLRALRARSIDVDLDREEPQILPRLTEYLGLSVLDHNRLHMLRTYQVNGGDAGESVEEVAYNAVSEAHDFIAELRNRSDMRMDLLRELRELLQLHNNPAPAAAPDALTLIAHTYGSDEEGEPAAPDAEPAAPDAPTYDSPPHHPASPDALTLIALTYGSDEEGEPAAPDAEPAAPDAEPASPDALTLIALTYGSDEEGDDI